MNYDAVIASAVRDWPYAREFQRLFETAEHTIVEAKRDFEPEGWKPVGEWISRAQLHGRYVVWLVMAIKIATDGTVSPLEEPQLYVVEVKKVIRSRDDEKGQEWEIACVQFEEEDWGQLVENNGDFATVGFDMTIDSPVDRFATFWQDTRPIFRSEPPDCVAFRAPMRFMM